MIDLNDWQAWLAAEAAANPAPVCGLLGLEVLLVPAFALARRRRRAGRPSTASLALAAIASFAMLALTGPAEAAVGLALQGDRALEAGVMNVRLGESFHVDVLADFSDPIVGWGLDLEHDPGLFDFASVQIGAGFMGVNAPDGDDLAGLTLTSGIAGDQLLLARIFIDTTGLGLASLALSVTLGDGAEGFALLPVGAFDTVDFGSGLWVRVVPEPGTALLVGVGLAVLGSRRSHRSRRRTHGLPKNGAHRG